MLDFETHEVRIPKAVFLMGAWGLVLLLASVINQFFAPGVDPLLWLWFGATLLGLGAQLVAMVHGLGRNFAGWIVVVLAGWAFTFYVFKFDNGAHVDLFGDLPGVWLILLAAGYAATARQVHPRFWLLAGLHLAVGLIFELAAHGALPFGALIGYSALIFGLVAGVPLLVATLPVWYRPEAPATQPDYPAAAAVEDSR
jgi:hypothetical protein